MRISTKDLLWIDLRRNEASSSIPKQRSSSFTSCALQAVSKDAQLDAAAQEASLQPALLDAPSARKCIPRSLVDPTKGETCFRSLREMGINLRWHISWSSHSRTKRASPDRRLRAKVSIKLRTAR